MSSNPIPLRGQEELDAAVEERVPLYRVKVLYDYSPNEMDELSLHKNQLLEVISLEEDPWWTCRDEHGSIGVAPNNYLHKLYDHEYSTASPPSSSSPVDPSPLPSEVDVPATRTKQRNRDKKQQNPSRRYSPRTLGSRRNTDLSALTLLRKQADLRINALKSAVEKMDLTSISPNQNASPLSVMSDNSNNTHTIISHKDNEDDISNAGDYSRDTDYDGDALSSGFKHAQNDEDDASHLDLHQIREDNNDRSEMEDDLKVTDYTPQQISMAMASVSSPLRPNHVHAIDTHQSKNQKHHVHTKQVTKLPSIRSSKNRSTRHPNYQNEHPQTSPRVVSYETGFRYNPCRSVVYYPSNISPESLSTDAPSSSSLTLEHVYAYEGGAGVSGRGKNIMLLLDNRIIYPAASVLVILDTVTNKQSYFKGHKGDVSAICVHAEGNIAASAEQGKLCRILIWSLDLIMHTNESSNNNYQDESDGNISEIELDTSVRQVSGVNFSVNCKFLVCLAVGDHNSLLIYDIETLSLIASSRLGHNEVIQMGFNSYLYTPFIQHEEIQCGNIASPRNLSMSYLNEQQMRQEQNIESCYTLVSCGGKQVKFWTLNEIAERTDGNIMNKDEDGAFKARKLAVPRRKQVWQKKYVLEGTPCSDMDSPDITCFTLTYDGQNGPFTQSRIFTGTSSGAIYIWKHIEDHSMGGVALWLPKGVLLSIVTNVHDAPVVDIDYTGPSSYGNEEYEEDYEDSWVERVVTVCRNGIINIWKVNKVDQTDGQSSPFKQELCVSMTDIQNIGVPRCIGFNIDCSAVVIGTTCNSICMLSGLPTDKFTEIDRDNITLSHLISGHTAKVKKIAVHPLKSVMATVSSDKTLRIWDYLLRRQISTWKTVGSPTCVAFRHDGEALACGNEAGELIVLSPSSSSPSTRFTNDAVQQDAWNITFKRSIGPKAHSPASTNAIMTGRPLYKKVNSARSTSHNNRHSKRSPRNSSSLLVSKYSELTCLAYSPNGQTLAVGCRDKLIHILSVQEGYKRIAVCKGHCSYVQNIDFSVDGALLQSNDVSREVLHWEVLTGKQITHASLYKDVQWHTWTCVYGWPCQGIHNGQQGVLEDGDINAVARSKDQSLIVCGGSNTIDSSVKVFRFPTLPTSLPSVYGGHTSPVLDVSFGRRYSNPSTKSEELGATSDALAEANEEGELGREDGVVFTIGGNDMCIFQWRVSNS